MYRGSRHRASVPQDRWLVSYADFMTLLFAFFTSMYAASNVDVAKLNSVVQSMQRAFVKTPAQTPASKGAAQTIDTTPAAPATRVDQGDRDLQRELEQRLDQELKDGHVALHVDSRGVVISLLESGSFPVGSADLTPEARAVLSRIAGTIGDLDSAIRVEGHTDDVPIKTPRFASNWELSSSRAISVLQYLVDAGGISSTRLSASGYGEFHPLVPNDSPESRSKNRRVDLVMLNSGTRASEEPNAPRGPGESK
jgi:chemotaxis protein MotB